MAKTITSVYLDDTILGLYRERAALEERSLNQVMARALSAYLPYLAPMDDDELETA